MNSNARPDARVVGSLRVADGMGAVRMEVRLATGTDDVWSALTDPARLARWYGDVEGDLRLGGEYRAHLFATGWEGTGRIQACETRRRLVVTGAEPGQQDATVTEVTLTPDGDHTVLVWEEREVRVDLVAAYGAGVQIHVEDLAAHLAGRGRCDAAARWNELQPFYEDLAAKIGSADRAHEMSGKVVVARSMSLDGFIAGPGDAMDWIFDFTAPDADFFAETAAATGAMLVGRRTDEVGSRMEANKEGGFASSDEGYPFSGPTFILTHRPPDPPDPDVTYLAGDIGEAVATALAAAGGKNLQILGADVAGQCLQRGLVDEIEVYVLPVLLGDGIRFSSPGLARIDLEPLDSTRSGPVTILRFRVRKRGVAG